MPRTPRGVLDRARQSIRLIGDPPPLRRQSRGVDGRSPFELCPFLEPRANWTTIQVDFEWTSEGTDEFLGHGVARSSDQRVPIGVSCRLKKAWDPKMETNPEPTEKDALKLNAVQEDRRQGTSLSIDNRGPDRCWAAVDFPFDSMISRTYRTVGESIALIALKYVAAGLPE